MLKILNKTSDLWQCLGTQHTNVCSPSLLNIYVKIVCGWKFVFKPASPEYVVSRRPNKATNYLVLLIFCKQQEGQHGPNKTSSLKGFHVNKQHFFRTTCHSFDIISFLKTSTFWINRKKWTTFSSKKVIWAFDLTLHIYKQKKSIFPNLSKTSCPHIRSRGMEQRRCSERLVSKLDTFHNLKAWSWRLSHIQVCKRNSRRIWLFEVKFLVICWILWGFHISKIWFLPN